MKPTDEMTATARHTPFLGDCECCNGHRKTLPLGMCNMHWHAPAMLSVCMDVALQRPGCECGTCIQCIARSVVRLARGESAAIATATQDIGK